MIMQKPANWDTVEAFTGDFKTLAPGGYVCNIVQAKEDTTHTGKKMLILLIDIAEGEFKDFYSQQYERKLKINSEAKWQGVYRQLTEGNSTSFFKGLITSIENSNPGYKWDWNEKALKGKLFGGVFGQEEYLNNQDEIKVSTKCVAIRSVDSIRKNDFKVPEIKKVIQDDYGPDPSFGSQFGAQVFPEEEIPF
ncbi:hypothetical protein Ga0466249_004809 [Sporomusaceae bacterium BoRhaA]|uniref:hypothetical protein n=1 Tax=Pelorhabdus rhamnosifermentans TaxID=2772457 RepID=UPI001C0625C2|nr:hypothetical protein [Pelorhabdus rhamnosifermentans]MBU2703661.1 hypothetical protein [Pelorhabdus rhamnosifermentans]